MVCTQHMGEVMNLFSELSPLLKGFFFTKHKSYIIFSKLFSHFFVLIFFRKYAEACLFFIYLFF